MFGFFEAIYSYLQRQIGLRTDAANSSGSLHAKVTELRNTTAALPVYGWKNTTPKSWSANYGYIGTTEKTVISVSGSGFLTSYGASETSGGTSSTSTTIKLYIDGTLVSSFSMTVPVESTVSNEVNNLMWRFKTGFSITLTGGSHANTGSVYAKGFLD